MNRPRYSLTNLEVSDLFFNYVDDSDNLESKAQEFLDMLPSLRVQGITHQDLVEDFLHRL